MADLTYEQAEKIKDEWLSLFEQYPDLPRNPRMEQWASWHQKHTGVDYSLIISGPQALDYLRQHARKEQPEEEKKEEKDKHRHSETGEEKTEEIEKKEAEKSQEQETPEEDAEKTKKALEGYGKDQKPVEDKTHRAEGPTALEATSRLEQLASSAPAITPRLIVTPEAPVEKILRPMRAESQTKKYQELQKEQAFNPKPSLNEKLLNDPFFKQAEDDLRNEYRKKYEGIKKTLLEEKRADNQETYKGQQYHTEAGNKIPMADYMLEQYELGKIRHRGMDIETQLERDARNRFQELYEKEWHREQQTKPAEGSVGKPLYIPGHATFTAQEVTERYKQLYPKEYGQNYGEPERETLGTAEDMQPLQKEAAKEAAFFRSLGEKLGATDLSTELKASTERHPGEEPPATSPSKETTEEPLPTTQGLTTGRAAIKDVAPVVIQEHGAQSLEDNNRTKEAPTQVGGETKYSRAKAIREGLERLRAINEEARELSERKRAKTIIDQEPLSVAPRGVQESPRIEEPQFFRPSSQPQATPIVSQGGQPGGLFTRAINGGNNLGRNLFRGRPLGGFGRGLPGGLGQAGRAASQLLNVAKTASFLSNPAVLGSIAAGIFIAIVLAILMGWIILPGGTGSISGGGGGGGGGGGTIAACNFTQGGNRAPFKSRLLLDWIAQAANLNGIPPAILAGVARHESPSYTTNNGDDYAQTNYYYQVTKAGPPNEDTNAIGLMQLSSGLTPTASGPEDHCVSLVAGGILKKAADKLGKKLHDDPVNYYCPYDYLERIKRLCQTNRSEKGRTYYEPDISPDDSYINLCRLQDNIMVGAELLAAKMGGGSWNNDSDILRAVTGYVGAPAYAQEVLDDYKNCKPSSGTPGTPFTPLPGCVAAKREVPAYAEETYPQLTDPTNIHSVTTCGPTSAAMILASFGVLNPNSSACTPSDVFGSQGAAVMNTPECRDIKNVTLDWKSQSVWSLAGFSSNMNDIAAAVNKTYGPSGVTAKSEIFKTAAQVQNAIQATGDPVWITSLYYNYATNNVLDYKHQTYSHPIWSAPKTTGAIWPSGVPHSIVVYQVCGNDASVDPQNRNRVFIVDAVLGEKYDISTSHFEEAMRPSGRGEGISLAYAGSQVQQAPLGVPASGIITLCYGSRESPYDGPGDFHRGIDIANNNASSPVVAAHDGIIQEADYDAPNGWHIYLYDVATKIQTKYDHLQNIRTDGVARRAGDVIKRGDILGYMDTSGEGDYKPTAQHLHFGAYVDGQLTDPYPLMFPGKSCPQYSTIP